MLALALALPVSGAAGASTGTTGTGTGTTSPAPALSAGVEQCVTAPTQAGRSVTFTGQMETVAGAHRMAIEIAVQEHTGEEEGFHTLTSAGLGTWQRSEAGVKIYKVRQAVTDLPAPAVFRAIVRYRWLNEKGQVIRHDERRTPTCRQPGEHSNTETTPTKTGGLTPAKPERADPRH
ncbi:MAG TPA: hypothetical protein VG147_16875 [Solirubrobacteraceae bacterium]|jgi:hypothetical protein|nr:hypothetical protein [Solirubrobacteraceae bacterium]